MIALLFAAAVSTSIISAVFGMTGGMVLMFILGWVFPIATAMILHGIAQAFANGYRFWLLRAHVNWKVLPSYALGMIAATLVPLIIIFQPDPRLVNFSLGALALVSLRPPVAKALDIHKRWRPFLCGFAITTLQLIAGASGPLLDVFYVNSTTNQRAIVATKAMTQSLSHAVKILVFWIIAAKTQQNNFNIDGPATLTLIIGVFMGTRIGKALLDKLSNKDLPKITRRILLCMGFIFIAKAML